MVKIEKILIYGPLKTLGIKKLVPPQKHMCGSFPNKRKKVSQTHITDRCPQQEITKVQEKGNEGLDYGGRIYGI